LPKPQSIGLYFVNLHHTRSTHRIHPRAYIICLRW
jgi:hypothetical protein